jgi:IS1 family transposase
MELIATDHWKAYEAFIPQNKHIQSKGHSEGGYMPKKIILPIGWTR